MAVQSLVLGDRDRPRMNSDPCPFSTKTRAANVKKHRPLLPPNHQNKEHSRGLAFSTVHGLNQAQCIFDNALASHMPRPRVDLEATSHPRINNPKPVRRRPAYSAFRLEASCHGGQCLRSSDDGTKHTMPLFIFPEPAPGRISVPRSALARAVPVENPRPTNTQCSPNR